MQKVYFSSSFSFHNTVRPIYMQLAYNMYPFPLPRLSELRAVYGKKRADMAKSSSRPRPPRVDTTVRVRASPRMVLFLLCGVSECEWMDGWRAVANKLVHRQLCFAGCSSNARQRANRLAENARGLWIWLDRRLIGYLHSNPTTISHAGRGVWLLQPLRQTLGGMCNVA
jgi:hypothetical protein